MKTFILCFLCLFSSLNAIEPLKIISLGIKKESYAVDINNQGQILGVIKRPFFKEVFVWDPIQKLNTLEVHLTGLPCINNATKVVGAQVANERKQFNALFTWTNPFSFLSTFRYFHELGFPKEVKRLPVQIYPSIYPVDINDRDQILAMNVDEPYSIACLYEDFQVWVHEKKEFHKIDNTLLSSAVKINNRSQILGTRFEGSCKKDRTAVTVVYDYPSGNVKALPFSESLGADLNDNGQVVGLFTDPLTHEIKGFIWDPSEELIILDDFVPLAINNHKQVIGAQTIKKEKETLKVPMMWENGVFTTIESLLVDLVDDKGNQWEKIDQLVAINDQGEIVANGVMKGVKKALLLKPVKQ